MRTIGIFWILLLVGCVTRMEQPDWIDVVETPQGIFVVLPIEYAAEIKAAIDKQPEMLLVDVQIIEHGGRIYASTNAVNCWLRYRNGETDGTLQAGGENPRN